MFLVRSPSSSRQARTSARLSRPIKTRSGVDFLRQPRLKIVACDSIERGGGVARQPRGGAGTVAQQVGGDAKDKSMGLVGLFEGAGADQPREGLLSQVFGFVHVAGTAQEISEQGAAKARVEFLAQRCCGRESIP